MNTLRTLSSRLALAAAMQLPAAGLGAQQPATTRPPAAAVRRAPTCIQGLREYASVAEIPLPYDTVRITFERVQVPPSEFQAFMLSQFAKAGATGYVMQRSTEQSGMAMGFLPVFVPADSARVAISCQKPGPPIHEPNPGSRLSLSRN